MVNEIKLNEQDISEILKGTFNTFGEPQVRFEIDDGENGEKIVSAILTSYGDLKRTPAQTNEKVEG